MDKKKIAIIGGGASGLFAAAMLNDINADICLFEKNNKLGKKILASGNGKCNFTNIFEDENNYNNVFATDIIKKFSVEKTLENFSKMGLIYKFDELGRGYPVSECASSVLDCLRGQISNVKIKLDSCVEKLNFCNNKCEILCDGKKEYFDYVICCSGGSASNLGSEKSYIYLDALSLDIKSNRPSLAPIVVKENVKELSGVRIKCDVKLVNDNGNVVYCENGEVLFKDNGLSGIAIFNASSFINRNCGEKYKIVLDISNNIEIDKIKKYLKSKSVDNLFKGFLNDKIGEYIYNKLNIKKYIKLDDFLVEKIITLLKQLEFNVVSLYPLKDSQVCSGGISIKEVDENLKLKKYPSIYVAGELLDVDGICGGYNLQFAWSSAGVIAEDIKFRIMNS